MRFAAGLDLGQQQDYSALVVVERTSDGSRWSHSVRHIARWRGKPYPVVVAEVGRLLSRRPLGPETSLHVDATGVGRAVLDLLRQAHAEGHLPCYPREITITGADEAGPGGRTIPKRDLIAHLEVLLATNRLQVAAGLALARALREELASFRAKVTAMGHATYEAGGSAHDDLVIAVALATWAAGSVPEQVSGLIELQRELRRPGWGRQIDGASSLLTPGWGRYGIDRETNGW